MKILKLTTAALALACCACGSAERFKLNIPVSDDIQGKMITLTNTDTDEKIDSIIATGEMVVMEGKIKNSIVARLHVEGVRMPRFILEPGTINIDSQSREARGTELNERLHELDAASTKLQNSYNEANEEGKGKILEEYGKLIEDAVEANADNALGFYLFVSEMAWEMDAAGLREAFEKYPSFANYEQAKKLLADAEKREMTKPGCKFIDFEVTQPDGSVKRLSDYVGKGKFTLVDFWASWCGPCIRQTAVLKDIYAKYKDSDRLDILGVAVWDEVEATLKAIEKHQLPWECILDAQKIPTDIYGITGIPCIILFGPDGTILSRDKQNDELREAVDTALGEKITIE